MLNRLCRLDVAASVFAGLLAAGLLDLILLRSHDASVPLTAAAALSLGLYGAAGLVLGVLAGWAVAVISGALQPEATTDQRRDALVAAGILAGAVGALVLALGAALAHAAFVSKMHSKTLATIATGGVSFIMLVPAALLAVAVRRAALAVAVRLPRLGRAGRSGSVLALLGAAGVAAGALALSRADWRVLDLGPLKALAVVLVMGGLHWRFWHGTGRAQRLMGARGLIATRALLVVVTLALLPPAARLPESSPVFPATEQASTGLRLLLATARAVTDGDGDGYSARFGGGDCDDKRPDSYPGAEDVPGDGVDQNCQGGDAEGPAPVAGSAGTTPPEAAPVAVVKRPGSAFTGNLLIISVDALRADRLGVAGYQRRKAPGSPSLTPNIDALARKGAYFRRVWSQAPNTPRSFPSFLTARYPSDVAWTQRSLNYSPILPANETFFEQLARVGFTNIGIFSHFYFTADRALNQGFAEWSNEGAGTIAESNKDIASPRLVPKVIARLEQAARAKERFALWTHLFEPHSTYMVHPGFPVSLRGVDGLEEKYDYEIAFVDRWIGKVLKALATTRLAETTAVVLLADHGEAFGEHKRYFHGQDLTEEQLRVPLIVAVPGRQPVVVETEAAVVDVGPTLLDLVGITPPPTFRGRSLLPAIEGQPLPPRPLFAELLPASAWPKHEVMMVANGKKITHKISERRWELHDLTTDPQQQKDLSRDPRSAALLERLQKLVQAFEEGKR
jgi:arylsulfatase A-like enzyme